MFGLAVSKWEKDGGEYERSSECRFVKLAVHCWLTVFVCLFYSEFLFRQRNISFTTDFFVQAEPGYFLTSKAVSETHERFTHPLGKHVGPYIYPILSRNNCILLQFILFSFVKKECRAFLRKTEFIISSYSYWELTKQNTPLDVLKTFHKWRQKIFLEKSTFGSITLHIKNKELFLNIFFLHFLSVLVTAYIYFSARFQFTKKYLIGRVVFIHFLKE